MKILKLCLISAILLLHLISCISDSSIISESQLTNESQSHTLANNNGKRVSTDVITRYLPESIDNFYMVDIHHFPKKEQGYAIRYRENSPVSRQAEFYVYPLLNTERTNTHSDNVKAMTQAAIEGVRYAQRKGRYSEVDMLNSRFFELLGSTVGSVELKLAANNLQLYSLIYVTEKNGKFIKARMTIPDNEKSRKNERWQQFITAVFTQILNNIDQL